jgi:phenylalanyl-tRNA synthetase beta chain
MKVPLSWLKDFVSITLPVEELAHKLTMAGLEVEEIRFVGLPLPASSNQNWSSDHVRVQVAKISGIEWDPDEIVVGAILEVMPHPNADRLVLCRLYDGQQEHIVLTGAPNLFPYKGLGPLEKPLKVAYARQGAQLYDGHQPGQVMMTIKPTKIRGVESYSMACSEKELGISDDHEGVIILDDEAPTGMPLVDYMGDAVLDISITPNMARNASIIGVAREIAALTSQELVLPSFDPKAEGPLIEGRAAIEIQDPELNPRFVLGLIEDIQIRPSPYEIQRRLRLAGMRPINNIVDATNYTMLELGEPLHAFDYDVLVRRAGGGTPSIGTRTAYPGERLTTLDDVERTLDEFTILVTDQSGPLSIAGVMGGAESEVNEQTRNILLEGAAWNFISIRKTIAAQKISSEAAYRFSRGVHPNLAELGVRRGLDLMRQWADGIVARGLVDNYPLPPVDPAVTFTTADVERWLGISLSVDEVASILLRLEFSVEVSAQTIRATTPGIRLDIGQGITGIADLMEEIARIYGYDRIPETRLADALPPQRGNPSLETEEELRDLLVNLGLQEVITHRLTSPEREARLHPAGAPPAEQAYLRLANPIVSERVVMRRSLLASLLEIIERNARLRDRQAIFEIGPVFIPQEGERLPAEPLRLVIAMTGLREISTWQGADTSPLDFYDLKGVVDTLLAELRLGLISYEPHQHPAFHPGKCARMTVADRQVGWLGELHPLVQERYEFSEAPVLAAEFDLEEILPYVPRRYDIVPVPAFPPVLEDLAIVVAEDIPAARVAEIIQKAGGEMVTSLKLFDVYRGEKIGPGKKSLAYSLTYQAPDRTLTDQEVARLRQHIIQSLERELDARLRS